MLKIREISVRGYEKVIVGKDESSKLHAVIAIHNTVLGPSLGGVRMFPYRTEKQAMADALRLAKAMTFKAAISNLRLGGGKAVVIGDPACHKTRELFLSLGDLIHHLKGQYIAAEDSGIKPQDLDIVSERTPHVTGTTRMAKGSGDPSPGTALGLLTGMRTCMHEAFKTKGLKDATVAIQGVGQVGFHLAKLLSKEKARLIVSDLSRQRIQALLKIADARVVSPSQIYGVKAEIFSPCALGGILNSRTIREIQARIVAGGANNQFADGEKGARTLFKHGILHAPDYVINAGGLIQLYVREIVGKQDIMPWIREIDTTLRKIFAASKVNNLPPLFIADRLAEKKIRGI